MSVPLTLDFIKDLLAKEGYELISKEYKNNHTHIEYLCPEGHRRFASITGWIGGARCAKCSNNAKMTIEEVRNSFEKEGYTLISTCYINAHTKLDYICPKGHTHSITWSNWNNKKKFRCPKCSNRTSKQELEIQNLLKYWGILFIPNCRTILINPETLYPLELDLWIPSLNKAIEFNGEYWHKDDVRQKLDRTKKKLCINLSIDLIVVLYRDWIDNTEEVKNKLYKFIFEEETLK